MDLLRKKGIRPDRDRYNRHVRTTATSYNYERIVGNWRGVFNTNFLALNYELLLKDPGSLMRSCFEFLEVEYINEFWQTNPINQTEAIELHEDLNELIVRCNSYNIKIHRQLFPE